MRKHWKIFILMLVGQLLCYQFSFAIDPETEIQTLLNLAKSVVSQHTDSAFILAKQAELLAVEHGLQDAIAQSAQLQGELFFTVAAYNQALENFLKAEKIWESNPNPINRAANHNHLGNLYYQLKRPDKVLFYHQSALKIYRALQNKEGIAATYGYIGHYYEKKEAYDSALFYQNFALNLYEDLEDGKGKSLILENLGSIYEDLGALEKARNYFSESLYFNQLFEDEAARIRILNNLGDISYKRGHYKEVLGIIL